MRHPAVLCAAALAFYPVPAGSAPTADAVKLERVHVDLCFPVFSGVWDIHVHAETEPGGKSYQPGEVILVGQADSIVQRPASSAYDFLGVGAGEPLWLMSQTGDIGLYLGFEAAYDFGRRRVMTQSSVRAWDHDGPGGSPLQRAIEISLTGVRGPGHVSAWFGYPEGPDIFFATSDGITPVEPLNPGDDLDEYAQAVGSHSHVSWGFTAPGLYELDFQSRTVLANGQESRSPVTTFYFEIQSIPEPACVLLLFSSLSFFAGRRLRHISLPPGRQHNLL